MNDLISRQQAIDKFEPWLKVEGYSEGEHNMLRAVLYELIVMPSAQPEQKWISCSERLPKIDEAVLVTTEWNDLSIAWRIGIDKWFIHEGNTNATTDDLVAWMPLPEPYKEGGADMRGKQE